MPTITTNDLKNGMTLELDRDLVQVVDFQHVKPGKGHAFVRTTLRNVRTGSVVDKTFRAGEKVERAIIDKRSMQFVYRDGADYVLMDDQTYDQIQVTPTTLGDATNYMVEQGTTMILMYGDEVIGVELPASVELLITETEPGLQGDRVSGARKPATLETGLVLQVPLFIENAERIKVDTRSGEYLSRA
ncbi:MAG: elongation factor P [Acidimicrobiales bacterium]|jgi:elongation factor P|nr:elongation factor P [Acidimicrobiaceae bacterium]MBT6091710.1 elongation factor P [Acidimicrobiaceae bacterium]MDE0833179.1 elongation factor P [Acidimicrobiales bacterium]|tara:strand:- start:5801 stop:6364 length:564 start_codon:yes stop_codon:yes gene_type:complete